MIMRAPTLIKGPPATPPPHTATPLHPGANRRIGEILLETGKLNAEQVARIARLQQESGIRFGDAAKQLGLLTEEDLHFAHARQYGYPCLRRGESRVSESIVAAYQPQDPRVETLRALRSQLMLRWFNAEAGRKAIAVVSPDRGEGRSYLAANLAVVFSQLGQNTLLLDADMRTGCQHQLFAVKNDVGLSSVLSGRSHSAPLLRLTDLNAFTILTAGPQAPNPQELLGREIFTRLLDRFATVFDVIIIDTPAGIEYADAQIIAAHTRGALMVARKDHTAMAPAAEFTDSLRELDVSLVGAVLNEF
jgi:receptor protein-tyrosine kinase